MKRRHADRIVATLRTMGADAAVYRADSFGARDNWAVEAQAGARTVRVNVHGIAEPSDGGEPVCCEGSGWPERLARKVAEALGVAEREKGEP